MLIERIVPKELQQDNQFISKAKLIIGVVISLFSIDIIMGLRQLIDGYVLASLIIFACGISLPFILLILKKTHSLAITGNCITFVFFGLMTYLIIKFGGVPSQVTPWYSFVVILCVMMAGFRSGAVWGVITILVMIIIFVSQLNGWDLQAKPSSLIGSFTNFTVLITTMLILGLIYESTGNKIRQKLDEERSQSQSLANELNQAIGEISNVMSNLSNFDLSKNISGEYKGQLKELKNSINQSLEMLNHTISQVLAVGQTINIGAQELNISAQGLASGTSMQASSLEEISATMDTVKDQSTLNDQSASKVREITEQSLNEVRQSDQKMEEMLVSMSNINEKSENVSKVIKVIDEIAFQTNLLALNAAVEAARAGKYGKGFAVVAEEVRNLASRSSVAAKDTTELIESSIKEVESGVINANQTSEAIKSVSKSINDVNDLVAEISISSKEQNKSVNEINHGIGQVNNIVQQNSSISTQTATSSEKLAEQSLQLQNMMSQFQLKKT